MTEVFRQQPVDHSGGVTMIGNPPEAFKQVLEAQRAAQRQAAQQPQMEAQPEEPQPQPQPQAPRRVGPQPHIPRGVLTHFLEGLDTVNYGAVNLPSKGIFYPNAPLSSGVVHVRPMTGSEEEILATPRYVKKNEAIDMIFQRCIQEQIDPGELLTIDRNYLLIWLRGISISSNYEVEVKCTECGNKFKTAVDLSELPVNYCPDDFTTATLTGVMPKTGFKFSYRLSNGKDEVAIANYRERKQKEWGAQRLTDDTLTYRTASLIVSISNGTEEITNTGEIAILLKRLPIGDGAYVRSLVNDPPFGVNTKLDLVCSVCGEEFSTDLPMEAGFFFPQFQRQTEQK